MKKSLFFRIIIYSIIIFVLRVAYIIVGYLLGFGSASGHFKSELNLDIILLFLNILSFWIFLRYIVQPQKKYLEFFIVSSLTLLFYVLQFMYFNQSHFFSR